MAEVSAEINFGGLKKLVKAMSRKYQIKVGLLATQGGSDTVSEDLDIAGLGAVHEYGCDIKITQKMAGYMHFLAKELGLPPSDKQGDGYVHIPSRSWLVMPISRRQELLKKIKKHLGGSKERVERYIIKTGDLMTLAILIGTSAVEQIQEAFDTEGFGEWTPNSPLTVLQKGSSKPLIDKGTLRGKVTYEVNENG